MAEYIDREALKKKFCEWCNKEYEDEPCEPDECPLRTMIIEAHAADVVEVVRCKNCIHWGGVPFGQVCKRWSGIDLKNHTQPMDYCSCGERKDCAE